jgi:hypothetical protein
MLDIATGRVRAHLDRSIHIKRRVYVFWAGAVAARKLGAADVVADAFMDLAVTSGLAADLGRHAKEDLQRVIRWGMFSRNPFGGRHGATG